MVSHAANLQTKTMKAKELFETGVLNVVRQNREELLSIKKGEKSYEELLKYAERLMKEIEEVSVSSTLRALPDEEKAKEILITIGETLYSDVTTNKWK